jgi:hypothetical protein
LLDCRKVLDRKVVMVATERVRSVTACATDSGVMGGVGKGEWMAGDVAGGGGVADVVDDVDVVGGAVEDLTLPIPD